VETGAATVLVIAVRSTSIVQLALQLPLLRFALQLQLMELSSRAEVFAVDSSLNLFRNGCDPCLTPIKLGNEKSFLDPLIGVWLCLDTLLVVHPCWLEPLLLPCSHWEAPLVVIAALPLIAQVALPLPFATLRLTVACLVALPMPAVTFLICFQLHNPLYNA